MWTRKELKDRAKVAFKANYWKALLVALVLGIVVGSSGGCSVPAAPSFNINTPDLNYSPKVYDDDDDDESGKGNDFVDDDDEEDDDVDDATVADADFDNGNVSINADDGDFNLNIDSGDGSYVRIQADENGKFNIDINGNDGDTFKMNGDGEDGKVIINGTEYDADEMSDIEFNPIAEMKEKAQEYRGPLIAMGVAFLVVFLFVFLFIMAFSIAFDIFLLNPIETGCYRFFAKNTKEPAKLSNVVFAFDHNYMNVVKIRFFQDLYIFLWSLLFVIPGIIKSYEYRMVPYIVGENPKISKAEAFRLSKEMMMGNKWRAFVLDLSFIPWDLLSILTCGILSIFWVDPYRQATYAELYMVLKNGFDIGGDDEAVVVPPTAPSPAPAYNAAPATPYSEPVATYDAAPAAPTTEVPPVNNEVASSAEAIWNEQPEEAPAEDTPEADAPATDSDNATPSNE